MDAVHSCARMPRGLSIADGGGGWRIRFPGGSEWAREVAYCPFGGVELDAAGRRDPARFPGGRPKNARAVRCLDTGEEFPSLAAAARAVGCGDQAIRGNIKGRQKTAAGMRWEFA